MEASSCASTDKQRKVQDLVGHGLPHTMERAGRMPQSRGTMAMQLDDYRLLGRSGLRASPLCLGTMTFGVGSRSWGCTDEEAARVIACYIEQGGNFIDTANFYGRMGQSEVVLGRNIQGRRDRLVIATKYSLTTSPGDPNACGNQRKNMVRSVEASLERMQTDYID